MVRWVVGSIFQGEDPLSYFSLHPELHDWCNKDRGMCYLVCGMVHIKEPLLLIGKISPCGGSGFPLLRDCFYTNSMRWYTEQGVPNGPGEVSYGTGRSQVIRNTSPDYVVSLCRLYVRVKIWYKYKNSYAKIYRIIT